MSVVEQMRALVVGLISDWSSFTSAEIFSEEYNDKAEAIAEGVVALATLHPRWSPEERKILPLTKENAHLSAEGEDPLFSKWEHVEDLFSAWDVMQSTRRTLNSVMDTVPSVWGPLFALSANGFVSREVRIKLI